MFRKSLLYIRKNYNTKDTRVRFLSIWGAVFLFGVLAGVAVDIFLPFEQWWNVLRAALVIPTAAAGFILAYSFSLFLHYRKVSQDYSWEPYRARLSAMWRRRIAAIIATVGVVILYANSIHPSYAYTLLTTLFAVLIISLFAYIRPSREEARREALDIPDARDIRYEQRKAELLKEQEREERLKEKRKVYEKAERRKSRRQRKAEHEVFEQETGYTTPKD